MKKYRLVCSVCGKPFERDTEPYVCESCGGLLEPEFDLAANASHYREVIRGGLCFRRVGLPRSVTCRGRGGACHPERGQYSPAHRQ